jgi:N-acetylmuramic acid 6-phosphate (MurNAc-6-P) etherase
MQRGDYERARTLAEQAEADAKLALAMSENARSQRALREELERKGR